MATPNTNQVSKRVQTEELWISELMPNDRGVLRIAHHKTDETLIFFEIENNDGIQYYESKREFTYQTAYKYVARGLYFKGMSKGITKSQFRDW